MNFDIISNTRQSKNYSATVHPQLLKKPEKKMSLYCCTTPCHLTCYYQKDLYCLLQTEQKNMYYCYLCLMNSYFNYQVQLFWVRNKTISRLGIIESKVVLTRVFWCHDFFFFKVQPRAYFVFSFVSQISSFFPLRVYLFGVARKGILSRIRVLNAAFL